MHCLILAVHGIAPVLSLHLAGNPAECVDSIWLLLHVESVPHKHCQGCNGFLNHQVQDLMRVLMS